MLQIVETQEGYNMQYESSLLQGTEQFRELIHVIKF